jgi:hypothetical protein
MKMIATWVTLALTPAISDCGVMFARELQPETQAAWEEYIRGAKARMETRVNGDRPFLWSDEAAGRTDLLKEAKSL